METTATNFDQAELAKFSALAHRWWDPNSEFKPLHDINPLRLEYIENLAGGLEGKRVIDVGCGGGILSEAMARRGARVTGIDLSSKGLKVAQIHAFETGIDVRLEAAAACTAVLASPALDAGACRRAASDVAVLLGCCAAHVAACGAELRLTWPPDPTRAMAGASVVHTASVFSRAPDWWTSLAWTSRTCGAPPASTVTVAPRASRPPCLETQRTVNQCRRCGFSLRSRAGCWWLLVKLIEVVPTLTVPPAQISISFSPCAPVKTGEVL